MRLPIDLPWLKLAGTQAILGALDTAGGETRLVGGAVRDALLGLPVTDIDLATRLAPDVVVARLKAAGLKAVPTGIAHGTITAVAADVAIEVTTLRRDVTTDGRHAEVAFTDDWREDAARRDFTINALYANPLTGEVSDFFGGEADLAARRVRFIGNPLQRIAEDHLRILRFFRFHAHFGAGDPDAESLAACARRANDLMALSRERIRDELSKLLTVVDPVPTLALMQQHAILRPVLPEILPDGPARLAELIGRETDTAWVRRLASLLPVETQVLDVIAYRLRLSNAERRRLILTAARFDRTPPAAWRAAWYDGAESVVDRLLLQGDAPVALLDAIAAWDRPKLPASGRDLIARGIAAGPEVKRRLAQFEAAWVAAGFPSDRSEIDRLLDSAAQA